VFHVSRLKFCKGQHRDQYLPLPLTTTEQGPLLPQESILQTVFCCSKVWKFHKCWLIGKGCPRMPLHGKIGQILRKITLNSTLRTKLFSMGDITNSVTDAIEGDHVATNPNTVDLRKSTRDQVCNTKYFP